MGASARESRVSVAIYSLDVVGRPGLHQSGLTSLCFVGCLSPGPRKNDLTIYWALGPFVRSFTPLVDPGDIYPPHPPPSLGDFYWARPRLYRKGEGEREPGRGRNGRFKAPLMRGSDGRKSNGSIEAMANGRGTSGCVARLPGAAEQSGSWCPGAWDAGRDVGSDRMSRARSASSWRLRVGRRLGGSAVAGLGILARGAGGEGQAAALLGESSEGGGERMAGGPARQGKEEISPWRRRLGREDRARGSFLLGLMGQGRLGLGFG
jgi:hypothetical protein